MTRMHSRKKIDFAIFLHGRRISKFDNLVCLCEWNRQTTKHVVMHTLLHAGHRSMLIEFGLSSYRRLVESPKALEVIVR